MRVRMSLRPGVWVLAVALTFGAIGETALAATSALQQEQANNQDYSKNKAFQQGLREGQNDQKHNKDHSKKRHYKKDEDQRAYEAGYQTAHKGDQHNHR